MAKFLISFGVIFPGITFNLVPGETSAVSLVGSIFWMFLKRKYSSIIIFLTVFVSLLISTIFSIYVGIDPHESIKQLFAYSQILAVFLVISSKEFEINKNLVFFGAFATIIVGIIQIAGHFGFLLEPLLSLLIPRGTGSALFEIGRGAPLLTSEPSHAAQCSYIIAYLIARYYFTIDIKKSLIFSILYLVSVILLSGAGVGLVYFFVFLTSLLLNHNFRIILTSLISFMFFAIIIYFFLPIPERLISLIDVLISTISNIDLRSLIVYVMYVSGFRFPSVYASYAHLFDNPFPLGPGSWTERIFEAYNYVDIDINQLGHFVYTKDPQATKPYSLFANIVLEFGLIGLFMMTLFLYWGIKLYFLSNKINKLFLPVAIFGLLFLNTTGNPVFMSIFAYCYKDYKIRRYLDAMQNNNKTSWRFR